MAYVYLVRSEPGTCAAASTGFNAGGQAPAPVRAGHALLFPSGQRGAAWLQRHVQGALHINCNFAMNQGGNQQTLTGCWLMLRLVEAACASSQASHTSQARHALLLMGQQVRVFVHAIYVVFMISACSKSRLAGVTRPVYWN